MSATFLIIYGSPRNGTLLEAAGVEPLGFPPPPRGASALVSFTSCRVSTDALLHATIFIAPDLAAYPASFSRGGGGEARFAAATRRSPKA